MNWDIVLAHVFIGLAVGVGMGVPTGLVIGWMDHEPGERYDWRLSARVALIITVAVVFVLACIGTGIAGVVAVTDGQA